MILLLALPARTFALRSFRAGDSRTAGYTGVDPPATGRHLFLPTLESDHESNPLRGCLRAAGRRRGARRPAARHPRDPRPAAPGGGDRAPPALRAPPRPARPEAGRRPPD